MSPSSTKTALRATPTRFIACPDCDLLHRPIALEAATSAACQRCGSTLQVNRERVRNRAAAFLLASLILLVTANVLPFLSLSLGANRQESYLLSGVYELFTSGHWFLAAAILATALIAPLVHLGGLLMLAGPRAPSPRFRSSIARVRAWAMLDVFLLGTLVALVKLSDLADIGYHQGFYAYVLLVVASTMATLHSEPLLFPPRHSH